jgi:hypothetical protein
VLKYEEPFTLGLDIGPDNMAILKNEISSVRAENE